jgi:hypothetical protein
MQSRVDTASCDVLSRQKTLPELRVTLLRLGKLSGVTSMPYGKGYGGKKKEMVPPVKFGSPGRPRATGMGKTETPKKKGK